MKSSLYISSLLSETDLPIQFHAFYWGKFLLQPFLEKGKYLFFAKATSNALEFELSLLGDDVYLHHALEEPLLISNQVSDLFINSNQYDNHILYDNRPLLDNLYSDKKIYKTPFRDPEDFEETEAYVELIKGINAAFKDILTLSNVEAREENGIKHLSLQTQKGPFDIIIKKELFDIELLNGLSRIIKSLGHNDTSFHLHIDPQMYMIILLLDEAELQKAKRIGLIV